MKVMQLYHTLHAPQVVSDDGSQCDSDKSFLEGDRPSSSSSSGKKKGSSGENRATPKPLQKFRVRAGFCL